MLLNYLKFINSLSSYEKTLDPKRFELLQKLLSIEILSYYYSYCNFGFLLHFIQIHTLGLSLSDYFQTIIQIQSISDNVQF